MKQLIESLVLPPMGLFITIVFGVLVLGWSRRGEDRRTARWLGRTMALGGSLVLVALCVPHVSFALIDSLQYEPAIDPAATTLDADAIVVLSGDVNCDPPEYGPDQPGALSMLRCRYGAALARRTGLPLLISGGVLRPDRRAVAYVLGDFVEDELSVPVRWKEDRSTDTRQNARYSAEILLADGIERVALVTHAWHMPRARREFELAGLTVIAAPTAAVTRPATFVGGLFPRSRNLRDSSWAIHEWVGRVWYRITE